MASTRRARRWALGASGLLLLALAGASTLADSGTSTLAISPPPGVAPDGSVAEIESMASSLTRTNGKKALRAGVTVARVVHAAAFSDRLKIEAAWLNPGDAHAVLASPNSQVHVGLYRPIHTGACTGATSGLGAPQRNVTDPDLTPSAYCAALDVDATGSIVSGDGLMILHRTTLSGYLVPSVDGTNLDACGASGTDWCRPAGIDADQNILWVAGTVINPAGNAPPGQQDDVAGIQLYFAVSKR